MPEMAVKNLGNKELRQFTLAEGVFNYPSKPYLVHEAVCHHLAAARAGTHSTKTRKEVSGGGKKPWKQKKTGRARAGSSRSPLWRGGGTVQGPKPRDYDYAFPRRKRANALRSVLSEKVREGCLVLLDELNLPTPRTKDLLGTLATLGLGGTRAMLVDLELGREVDLASRNLQHISINRPTALNAFDVLNHEVLVVTVAAVERLQEWLDS